MSPSPTPAALLDELATIVGPGGLLTGESERLVYQSDGTHLHTAPPGAVVLPRSTDEVAAIVRACVAHGVPYVARGAGTGLSGGSAALDGAVIVAVNRMDRILEVDAANRRAHVQPGVRNLAISHAAAPHDLYYAPDPSSQAVCTIGGNVAHNSGGPHTLKSGVTVNHVLGLELVLPDGEVLEIGGPDRPGYDLLALLTGAEGTLGIVTRVTVRLCRRPEGVRTLLASYPSVEAACGAVTAILGAGVVPAALELLDREVVDALVAAFDFDFPDDAGALLLVEADGPDDGMDADQATLEEACRRSGALGLSVARDDGERTEIWRARKQAFGALGRITRFYYTQDGVIPRTRLPEMLRHVAEVGRRHGLRVANVFHAGDGNLHPCILFDDDDDATRARVLKAGDEILRHCVALGGSLTGEHGVGVEKREAMALMFDAADLDVMERLRATFDAAGLCNPGKILPTGAPCHEPGARSRQVAL